MERISPITARIRTYQPNDLATCRALYREGLLGGHLADNDTGLDIDDIAAAYLQDPGNHFWVAEAQETIQPFNVNYTIPAGTVLGMIGVQRAGDNHEDSSAGEIRRLRVRQDIRRRGVGSKLLETAVQFCHDHSYIKVVLDTFIDREPALRLFEKFSFRHSRTRDVSGKQLLYFYLDLYHREEPGK